jgi:uncharacterized protein with NRDE domain
MCLILFAYDCHPGYRLIVAANRDEFYQRPTLPASFWDDNPQILAGRDLREGGTWMGITTTGRFAALTNYRDPAANKLSAPSRGHLVCEYLQGNLSPGQYIEELSDKVNAYNGFNLLLSDYGSLYYYSNREQMLCQVSKGIHGLSNSLLDVPWPKVTTGLKAFTNVVQEEDIDVEQLFSVMTSREEPDDRELPDTGLTLEMERMLAPVFVNIPDYGTRLTTVILVDRNNGVRFWERSYIDKKPDAWEQVHYEFQVQLR